jgi:ribokinase
MPDVGRESASSFLPHPSSFPRVVVVGSVNVDMVVHGRRLPGPGETVTGGEFLMAGGGKGANQAVAAARLGANVTLVAKVGEDAFGQQSMAAFREEGITTDFVFRDPNHATGVALILVDHQGENLISVASGANHALLPADIERAAEAIRVADVLLVQLEVPRETVVAAVQLAAKAGVPVILDPAPAPLEPLPESLLEQVTYLKPNQSEAERLSGIAVHDEASARVAAQKLLSMGARHVVITLGSRGALWVSSDGSGIVSSVSVEAIDATAAGDAFSGALACALGRGEPLAQAVELANVVGALATTRQGAQPSLPTMEEVERFAKRKI